MAPRNPHLPANVPATVFSKVSILKALATVDHDPLSRGRILALESGFRRRVTNHIESLPFANAPLRTFSTNPFVLMVYAQAKGYTRLSQIEGDILPAKLFSSMETSAGRMIEDVALPIYGWSAVPSGMHTANSALDGLQLALPVLRAATLKSGPRCLNDEMSENFADNVLSYGPSWLSTNGATVLDFSYGVLYGTRAQSNKKDWHILRKIVEKLPPEKVLSPPWQRWECEFLLGNARARASVRIGADWWSYLGGPPCLMEVCVALIRACVMPGYADPADTNYVIGDLYEIVSLPLGYSSPSFNVGILQASQIPWLLFLMRHFCDAYEN
ncbi:PmeII family type II restriction endonuclease [Rhodanobacter sp. OK091]|uniref:PmeII family type II restriction endonuclease n=1 Tax=Rhodanobacter sp. OK091 TaxID=1881037 RepID=UPI00090EE76F|nr:PmeII family type II restriction endonuclease [Rhodanobacter sp. OK091]SHL89631.1 hypothetical protein SAMN05428972_1809 [Rhodanobacter sp. OK091]